MDKLVVTQPLWSNLVLLFLMYPTITSNDLKIGESSCTPELCEKMTGGKWIHVFILDRNISDIKPHILEGCGEGMRVLHLFMAENVSARMLMSMM
jgi:hypothetical protein